MTLDTRSLTLVLLLALPAGCAPDGPPAGAAGSEPFQYVPEGSPADLGLAGYAKVVCSAVFVSGRDPAEAARNSGYFLMPPDRLDGVGEPRVDREAGLVSMTWGDTLVRAARFMGDQGCVLLPEGRDRPFYEPVPVTSSLPPADALPWPMGDRVETAPPPVGVDTAAVGRAVDAAFAAEALTQAFLVVHRGRIVAERYAPGTGAQTQLESWSMGKSLTAGAC